jgi:Cu(I)/Ag(I) efflux system protein CusF
MHTSFLSRLFFALAFSLALVTSAFAQSGMTDGEVKKVDAKAQTITLKHGEIKNLHMSPMTMVFKVPSAAMLTKLKVGDKVKFKAEMAQDALTLVAIEPAP